MFTGERNGTHVLEIHPSNVAQQSGCQLPAGGALRAWNQAKW